MNDYIIYKFGVNKLVRDWNLNSNEMKVRKLNEKEYKKGLYEKFLEEAEEVYQAQTQNEIAEELGDILEILIAYGKIHDITFDKIEEARLKKERERGKFKEKLYGEYLEISENSENKTIIKKFLNELNKYPLISIENNSKENFVYEFQINKLVRDRRDKLPNENIIEMNSKDYNIELKKKLLEEVNEIIMANKDEEIMEKFADLLEVTYTYLKVNQININEIEEIRKKKLENKGGFEKKLYMKNIKLNENSKILEYYLRNQEKYPLIKVTKIDQ